MKGKKERKGGLVLLLELISDLPHIIVPQPD